MEGIPLGFSGLSVPSGSHVGYVFASDMERRERLFAYIAAGLQNGERCIAAIAEFTEEFWLDGLRAHGIDVESVRDNQLVVLTAGRLLNGTGSEAVRHAADALNAQLDPSLDGAWNGTRICTGFTHLYQCPDALPDLVTADCRWTDLFRGRPITVMCTFSSRRLKGGLLDLGLKCHPLVTDGNSLTTNHDYLKESELGARLPAIMSDLAESGALDVPFVGLDFTDDVPILRVGDESDVYTAPCIEETACYLVDVGHRTMIADLSRTTFIDAASIAVLVRIHSMLEEKGGSFAIYDPAAPARTVFRLSRIAEVVPVRQRLDAAVDALAGRS